MIHPVVINNLGKTNKLSWMDRMMRKYGATNQQAVTPQMMIAIDTLVVKILEVK
jgi:hypothetical protein